MSPAAAAVDSLVVPSPFDAHVHLREGPVSALVTPHVRQGGMDIVYVMVRHQRWLREAAVARAG
jgi:dihydroorotase